MSHRSDTLDRFAVLDVQMQQLKAQLRPMTKRHVVYPRVGSRSFGPLTRAIAPNFVQSGVLALLTVAPSGDLT